MFLLATEKILFLDYNGFSSENLNLSKNIFLKGMERVFVILWIAMVIQINGRYL